MHVPLSREVSEFVARNVTRNARDIVGAVKRLRRTPTSASGSTSRSRRAASTTWSPALVGPPGGAHPRHRRDAPRRRDRRGPRRSRRHGSRACARSPCSSSASSPTSRSPRPAGSSGGSPARSRTPSSSDHAPDHGRRRPEPARRRVQAGVRGPPVSSSCSFWFSSLGSRTRTARSASLRTSTRTSAPVDHPADRGYNGGRRPQQ